MKRKYIVAGLLVLAGMLSYYLSPIPEQELHSMAMNTVIRLSAKTRDESLMGDASDLLVRLEHMLSMYDPSSDVSRINAGEVRVSVPHEVVEVITKALQVHELSDGVFNPLIGAVTRLWKINAGENIRPSTESLAEAISLTDIHNLVLEGDSVYLRHKGCVLDLGGIAKGYAGDKLAELFRSRGVKSGLIDLGGNICVVGTNPDGQDWNIGVRDPNNPRTAPALVVRVRDCSVITSGNYERYKLVDGKRYSHFFDPKTGEAVMSDLLSVTLIDSDGALADGLATAFMAAGFEKARELIAGTELRVIMIRGDEIFATRNLEGVISRNKYQVTFF